MAVDTQWLNEREYSAWRSYQRMAAQLPARLNRELQAASQLSGPDFAVLVQLTDVPEHRVRVLELAQSMQWEKSRLSHHLRRMQSRGLVTRVECPVDGRGAFVVLTEHGQAAIEQAAPAHVATVRRLVFDELTSEEVDVLQTITTKVLKRLEADR